MKRPDEVRMALWAMVSETGKHAELAEAVADALGWTISPHSAQARVSQWLSPSDRHHFPASLVPLAIRVTGRDYVSPILHREALRAEMAREDALPPRPGPVSVRRDRKGRARA